MSSARVSGSTVGAERLITWPSLPTRNLVKFHSISSPSAFLASQPLRQACERVHYEYIAAHAPQGGHAGAYSIHTPSKPRVRTTT